MNYRFRTNDQFTVTLLLIAVLAGIGLSYTIQYGALFAESVTAIEFDSASREECRFEIDLNSADWPELTLLPGIGEKLALRIVEFRVENRGINHLSQLLQIDGIGPKKMETLRKYLRIDFNSAKQLPESGA